MLIKFLLSFITILSLHTFNYPPFTGLEITVPPQEKSFFHFTTRKETKNLKKSKRHSFIQNTSMVLTHSSTVNPQKIDLSFVLRNSLNFSNYMQFQLLQVEIFFNPSKLNKSLISETMKDNNHFFRLFLILEFSHLYDFSPSFSLKEEQKNDRTNSTFYSETFPLVEESIPSENQFLNKETINDSPISQPDFIRSLSTSQKRFTLIPLSIASDSSLQEKKENTLSIKLSVAPRSISLSAPSDDPGATVSDLSLQHHSTSARISARPAPLDRFQKYKGHTQATYEASLRRAGLTSISSPLKVPYPSSHGCDPASYRQWGSSKNSHPIKINPFILFLEDAYKQYFKKENLQRSARTFRADRKLKRSPPLIEFSSIERETDSVKLSRSHLTTDNLEATSSKQIKPHRSTSARIPARPAPLDRFQKKYKGHTQATYEASLKQAGLTSISNPLKIHPPSSHGYDPASYRQWGSSKNTPPIKIDPFILFLEEAYKQYLKKENLQYSARTLHREGLEAFSTPALSSHPAQKRTLKRASQDLKNELEATN